MPRIRNQTLTYTRDAFREDIFALFASVQPGRDSFTVTEFKQTFEALTSKQFPSAASLGFANDHEMFNHVRDICRIDVSSGYVRVIKCSNGEKAPLASLAPGSQRSRQSTISLSSSDDDVLLLSPSTNNPQLGNSSVASFNFPNGNLNALNGENQVQQQRGSYQNIPAAFFANQSRGMRFPNNVDVRATQLHQFHALPRTVQQEQQQMMARPPTTNSSNAPISSNQVLSGDNPLQRSSIQTAIDNHQGTGHSTNGLERTRSKTFRDELLNFPNRQHSYLAQQELMNVLGSDAAYKLSKERNWSTMNIVEMCALVDEVRANPQVEDHNRTNRNTSQQSDHTVSSSPSNPTILGSRNPCVENSNNGVRPKKQNTAAVPVKRHNLGQSPDFLPIVVENNLPEPPSADENDPVKKTVDQIEDAVLISEQAILPKSVKSEADMDTACKIIKQNMCASREFVCAYKVEKALLQFYKMRSLSEFRVGNVRHINQIPCLRDLSMKERKVNLYIDMFVEMRNVCTISDLEILLTNLNSNYTPGGTIVTTNGASTANGAISRQQKETFESMYQMGPLYKNPMIYEKFKFPTDGTVEPTRLNSTEVANMFKEYLATKNLWASRELQTNDFLTFLCDKLEIENPWHIGIKIVSLPLLKSVLSRAQGDCKRETERIVRELTEQLVADLRVEIKGMRDQITASLHINTNTIYAFIEQVKLVSTVDLLKKCFDFCKPLLRYASQASIEEKDARKRRKRFGEVCDCFEQFFDMCRSNPVAEALFEFTLLTSSNVGEASSISEAIVFVLDNQNLWLDVVKYCPKNIGCEQYFTSEINGNQMVVDLVSDDDDVEYSGPFKVTLKAEPVQDAVNGKTGELECFLLELLSEAEGSNNGLTNSSGITLEQLEAIEVKLSEESRFNKMLKKCSMLKFITSTEKLLEPFSKRIGNKTPEVGQNIFGSDNALTLDKIKIFVSTCESESSTSEMFDSLKRSYGFEDSLDDQVRSQIEDVVKESLTGDANVQIPFADSYACSVDLSSSLLELYELRCIAISKISQLPYLKCVASELNWNSHFRPRLGKLDQFLEANISVFQSKSESFVHLNESQIVKVPTECSFDSCNEYLNIRDSRNFSASLVAFIVSSGGVKSFPFQLSQSEFHGSFNTLYQRKQLIELLTSSICLLPLCFVPPIYGKIFKPLAEKVGVCDLEEKILNHILNEPDQTNLLTLGMIGNVIGEKQWTNAMLQASPRSVEDSVDSSQQDFDSVVNRSKSSFEITAAFEMQSSEIGQQDSELINSDVLSNDDVALTEKSDVEIAEVLSRESECKQIINEILSQEFGEGIEVSREAQALLDKHQERIGRSLERLSKELYSQDVHFILELIQNADDNNYDVQTSQIADDATKKRVPTLIFVLESDKLRVLNNERGFESENIRALCDVGKTTKGKHRKGLIGQKGIGFKSVFRVTDRPEIHSNGFHICFDAHNGALGMIKPQWLDKTEREVSSFGSYLSTALKDDLETGFSTQIVLPFAEDSLKMQTFTTKLKQIEPSLLLFLNNLRKIKICLSIEENKELTGEEQARVLSIEKRMLSDKVVCIESTNVCQFFLLETFSIPVPEHLNLKLLETEVCFAFPLEKSATSKSFSFNYHQTQNAFAFLPVREFGLKFIVQADFEIPSSRQDIDLDSAFNQWISVQMPQLFLRNLKSFEEILKDSVHAAIAFLNFLPLPNETFGFFKPVAQKICELIKNSQVIPTVNGELCLPAEAINCGEKLLSTGGKFIDTELFTKATGWKLAHKEFDLLRPSIVKQLGLHTVGINDILVTLEYFCTAESINCDEIEKLNTVRNILYSITSNFNHQLNATNLENLKKIAFIPLANGKWVSAQENSDLFCNSDRNQEILKKLNLLKIVDQQLLTDQGKTINDIQKLLVRIGVKVANMRELVKYHVVEVLINEDLWSQLSQESVSDYTAFLITSWTEVLATTEQVRINNLLSNFPVVVRKGETDEVVHSSDIGSKLSVYFPSAYKPKIVLATIFPSTQFCVLSDCYLKSSTNQNQAIFLKQAFEFFSRMRIAEFFQFRETQTETMDSEGNPEICRDFTSELLEILINISGNVSRNEYIQLFTLVSHFWPEISSCYLFARVNDGKLGAVKLVKSSVAKAFLESSWVPVRIDNKLELAKPEEVFVNTQETRNIFRQSDVKTLDPKIQIETISVEFIKFIGVNVTLTTEIVLNYLRTCSQDPSFKSNLDHLAHVYQFLQSRLAECNATLQQEPLIYLPNPNKSGEFGFYTIDNLIMDDPSGLFDKYKQTLNKHKTVASVDVTMFKTLRSYRFLGGFFDLIGALSEPSPRHYYQLMMTLVSAIDMTRNKTTTSAENRVEDLFRLIALSATEIQTCDVCIPCSNNTLTSLSDDNILLPDDSSTILYAMFEQHADLKIVHNCILEIPEEIREKVMEVLTGNFKLLVSEIMEDIVPGQLWTCSTVHKFVYFICPLVQRYIRRNSREKYEKGKQALAETLKSLKIFACKEIEVIYTYKNVLAEKSTKFIFCDGKEFYIGREYLEDWNLISKELSTLFSFGERDNYLALFIDGLVKYFNKEPGCLNVENFLNRFGIPPLPGSDPKWSVSQPNYSQMLIDLEIRRNAGDNTVTEEDLKKRQETAQEADTKPKSRGPGQWPPLPPRGYISGKQSTETMSGDKNDASKELPPPPPRPSYNWSSEYVVPPRLAAVEPNRVLGDTASGSVDTASHANKGQSSVNIKAEDRTPPVVNIAKDVMSPKSPQDCKDESLNRETGASSAPLHVRGEKRSLDGGVNYQQPPNLLSSSPQGSTEKKRRSDEPDQDSAVSRNSEDTGSTCAVNDQSESGGSGAPISSNINMQVTLPDGNTSFASCVTCQLESLDLSRVKRRAPTEEELNKLMLTTGSSGNTVDKKALLTGRFGEQLVYEQLCDKWKNSESTEVEIAWLNEKGEQYRPYDICITYKNNNRTDFIEVKSTSSPHCEFFNISSAELKFANEKGESYFIFFVFNALESNASVTYFSNLRNKLDSNQVSLLLQLHK